MDRNCNDPKWVYSNVTTPDGSIIESGSYIMADGRFTELLYLLPDNPTEGDVITFKDCGGLVGVNSILVKSNTRQYPFTYCTIGTVSTDPPVHDRNVYL
ncbi:proximal tail fiber subunit [Klebsiella phage CPRSA]|nr:proximal tail fiber subunit [Klebsiella phage CPRSA]